MHSRKKTSTIQWAARALIEPPKQRIPLGLLRAVLGFPSPAEDFQDDCLDLNELLVRNPPSTFFYRAEGDSMTGAGIYSGDLLVVDRSLTPIDGDLVIAIWEGNTPVCKVLRIRADHIELESRNPSMSNLVLAAEVEVEMFCVTGVVRALRRRSGRRQRVLQRCTR